MTGTNDTKHDVRRRMRSIRASALTDPAASASIVDRVEALPAVVRAATVMVFEAVPGEPDLSALTDRLRGRGVAVVAPAASRQAPHPIEPSVPDVVIVPGIAFSRSGVRLGQGAGWYDRFLGQVRVDCVIVGVCADEQVLADLPADQHDVPVDWIVTPSEVVATGAGRISRPRSG